MKVFKFGGASVKDADGVKNLAKILYKYKDDRLFVIVSAMGKTTNDLEDVARSFYLKKNDVYDKLKQVEHFHYSILKELFKKNHEIYDSVANLILEIEWILEAEPATIYSPSAEIERDSISLVAELFS